MSLQVDFRRPIEENHGDAVGVERRRDPLADRVVGPPPDHPDDVAAVQGYLMAFRRADAAGRGPIDEAFRFYRNLDIWWSLVLRDEGEDRPPRRAVAVPDLPLVLREPWAWTSRREADRDRLSKRNFYRFLGQFRSRLDLAVPPS